MIWDQLTSFDDIFSWAESQSWFMAMCDCPQDARWHSEGNVATHTRMVCHQLLDLNDWGNLSQLEQKILIFASLLHDCGKPLCTNIGEQGITSHKHAVKGEQLSRSILRSIHCDLDTREQICSLVRFHTRPVFLLDKKRPEHEVIFLSWLLNNKLLYYLALADNRGRDTDSLDRCDEDLHLWKLVSEECDCFDKPFPFANDMARFLFYRQDEPNIHYVPHEDYQCVVTMVSGLPGSGKDTWLKKNSTNPSVSLDDIREELGISPTDNQGKVLALALERCREFLRLKQDFNFNATNILRNTRQRWINLFHEYGAYIKIVYIEPPIERILSQNRNRDRQVPEEVIQRLVRKSEPPTWSECHSLLKSSE